MQRRVNKAAKTTEDNASSFPRDSKKQVQPAVQTAAPGPPEVALRVNQWGNMRHFQTVGTIS